MQPLRLIQNHILPFPVRRVYCVGRNYAEHRQEMGGSERELPFFFMKPSDSVFQAPSISYPSNTAELSYEAELVVLVGENESIFGYSLGVDLTKRDLQKEAKKMSRPWESSKSFDFSALIGDIVPYNDVKSRVEDAKIELKLNGTVKQSAIVDQMIWSIPELISQLKSQDFSVKQGDVIFTGTPAGVGPLKIGDKCEVSLTHEGKDVVPRLVFSVSS